MEDLKKGMNEKGLIEFVKTCLLSGSDPRGKEAVKNLEWGIKQYRKHLILHGVSDSFPLKETDLEKWINDKKEKISYKDRNEMSRAFYDAEFAGWKLCFDKIKSGNYH